MVGHRTGEEGLETSILRNGHAAVDGTLPLRRSKQLTDRRCRLIAMRNNSDDSPVRMQWRYKALHEQPEIGCVTVHHADETIAVGFAEWPLRMQQEACFRGLMDSHIRCGEIEGHLARPVCKERLRLRCADH